MSFTSTIEKVLTALLEGQDEVAINIAKSEYPHSPRRRQKRSYSATTCMRVFMRDGFIDRYSGMRLVFPGALRILTVCLPNEFPCQAHWKMNETHIAYWELYPTVDHIHPVARGGGNDEANLVTTSQLRNSAKSNWSLDELGWTLHQPRDLAKWDGLLEMSLKYIEMHPKALEDKLLRKWCNAAIGLKRQESKI